MRLTYFLNPFGGTYGNLFGTKAGDIMYQLEYGYSLFIEDIEVR